MFCLAKHDFYNFENIGYVFIIINDKKQFMFNLQKGF